MILPWDVQVVSSSGQPFPEADNRSARKLPLSPNQVYFSTRHSVLMNLLCLCRMRRQLGTHYGGPYRPLLGFERAVKHYTA